MPELLRQSLVSPRALQHVPPDEPFDMPELIQRLIDAGERVGSYAYDGLWLDIGRNDDYETALAKYGPSRPGLIRDASELSPLESPAADAPGPRLRAANGR